MAYLTMTTIALFLSSLAWGEKKGSWYTLFAYVEGVLQAAMWPVSS